MSIPTERLHEALRIAILSKASYDPKDNRFRSHKDLRFGIVEGSLIVRGTDNKRNILRDLTAIPWKTRNGEFAHYGFARAADKVLSLLTPAEIASIRNVGGHSFGAATGRLIADLLRVPAITIGCPRVYFKTTKEPSTDHLHIVCDDDPVPMIPRIFFKLESGVKFVLKDRDGQLIDIGDHDTDVYIRRLKRMIPVEVRTQMPFASNDEGHFVSEG